MSNQPLQEASAELLHASVNFLARFSEAVVRRLPSYTQDTVTRAVDRFFECEIDSPIIGVIHADAAAARLMLIASAFDGDANSFVDTAVERSATRVSAMFGCDNVVMFDRKTDALNRKKP
jgi:hypothetical protein